MNPIIEARKNIACSVGTIEISSTILDKGYQWLAAQALMGEVYADGISFTFRFAQAQEFLQHRLRKSPYLVLRPKDQVKRGQDQHMYMLPQEIVASLILRYGIDVVRALYNAKKIDVAKKDTTT